MLAFFFFPPSPIEIAALAVAGFFLFLPEINRGYCYARWLASKDAAWLNRQPTAPRWFFAIAWIVVFLFALIVLVALG